jgi:hypothetical protein
MKPMVKTGRIIAPRRGFRYQGTQPVDMAEALAARGYSVELLKPPPPDVRESCEGKMFKPLPLDIKV